MSLRKWKEIQKMLRQTIKKEDIKQPLLLDVFRRGENSFTIQIDKTGLDSLKKLPIIGGIRMFSALSGENELDLSAEAGWLFGRILTFFEPPRSEAIPNFTCKSQPHTLAAAGKVQFFLCLTTVAAPFTEQPHAQPCCKTKNASEFAAEGHYL